jgi:hypothetical protein
MAEEAQETSAQFDQVVVFSCSKRLGETNVQDFSPWHHLTYEKLQNDYYKDVVCWLCNEPVLGCLVYKCSQCNFHQHESCTARPHGVDTEIEHKYWWKRHHLISIHIKHPDNGGEREVCSGCKKPTFGSAFKCSIPKCTFLLHKYSCGKVSPVIRHAIHPEHILFLREPSTSHNCSLCYKNCNQSFFYRCDLCFFNLHVKCLSHWRINDYDCHQHSLHPSRKQMQFTCESCGVKTKDTAYLCSECGVLIHGQCAQFPHTIKIKTHDHFLFRIYPLPQDNYKEHKIDFFIDQFGEAHIVDVFCYLCYKRVTKEYAAYYCLECSYAAHLDCAKEFQSYSTTSTNSVAGIFNDHLTHLVHLVEGIDLVEDQNAGPPEIKHFSHPQHKLILINEKLVDDMRCEACMQLIVFLTPFYGCTQCNFFLHIRCAKLPSTIRRAAFHEHSLTLFSRASSTDGLFWCAACRRSRHGFTYRCDECSWYNLDVQCCLIPETLEHGGHQHSLFFAIKSLETCNACGGKDGGKFVCIYCDKFALCFRCATLPLVAKYEHDTHLLKLSYTREDESGEYYCLICEEERDQPDYWFYYCVKCKFTAHPRCVIGENPCIKFGRTYIDEDHRHPLTIVQKTEHSPSCEYHSLVSKVWISEHPKKQDCN